MQNTSYQNLIIGFGKAGKTLAGFNKRIDKALKSLNVENVESLQKTLDTLKK